MGLRSNDIDGWILMYDDDDDDEFWFLLAWSDDFDGWIDRFYAAVHRRSRGTVEPYRFY